MSFSYHVGNIDVQIKSKALSALLCIAFAFFFAGAVFFFVCTSLYRCNISDYQRTHEELDTFAPITSVTADEKSDRLYVFYEDAGTVNVYRFDGSFVYSLTIPNEKNGVAYFGLAGDKLYLLWNETFVYRARDGAFLETHAITDAEEKQFLDTADEDDANASVAYDLNDVWLTDADGGVKQFIVDKPGWYALINPVVGWLAGFLAALFIFSIAVVYALRDGKRKVIHTENIGETAKRFACFHRVMTWVTVLYILLHIVLCIAGWSGLLLGIFPLTIIFIVSGWVYAAMRRRFNRDEQNLTLPGLIRYLTATVAAFLSVVICTLLFAS